MEHENKMPLYIQQVYIWALKIGKPLCDLNKKAHMYTYVTKDGGSMIIDLYAMHNFLGSYVMHDANTDTDIV